MTKQIDPLASDVTSRPSIKTESPFYHLKTLWLFTQSDLKTVILPQAAFGVAGALSGLLTTQPHPDVLQVFSRLPSILLWLWLNLLMEVISNQRLPSAVREDALNKPWRPLPSQRLTMPGARRLLLVAIVPSVLVVSWALGTWRESLALAVATWMYNDLGGADENYVIRNLLNACGLTIFGTGSTIIAAGGARVTRQGYLWLQLMGLVVFATVHVQDLADVEGDAARGRRTIPLVHGDGIARWSAATAILACSFIGPAFWVSGTPEYVVIVCIGGCLGLRVLVYRSLEADKIAWKIWCVWITALHLLPLLKDHTTLTRYYQGLR